MTKYIWTDKISDFPHPKANKPYTLYRVSEEIPSYYYIEDGKGYAISKISSPSSNSGRWNVFETDLEVGDKVTWCGYPGQYELTSFKVDSWSGDIWCKIKDPGGAKFNASVENLAKVKEGSKQMSKFVTTETKVVKTIPETVTLKNCAVVKLKYVGGSVTISTEGFVYGPEALRELSAGLLEIAGFLEEK